MDGHQVALIADIKYEFLLYIKNHIYHLKHTSTKIL